MEINEKFCPICKNKNQKWATVCKHCGESLGDHYWDSRKTVRDTKVLEQISAKIMNAPIEDSLIPDDGIAIYAAGASKPIYLWFDKELVFGRKEQDLPKDTLLDLSEFDGYQSGISREHAMIRRMGNGYEIVDLASTNGSWLNEERLIPNKPVPLVSGSQLRFGHLRLLFVYHCSTKKTTVQFD